MKGQDQQDYLAIVLEGPTKCSMSPVAISRCIKQKINKDIEELNHIAHQQHVTNNSKHSTQQQNTHTIQVPMECSPR